MSFVSSNSWLHVGTSAWKHAWAIETASQPRIEVAAWMQHHPHMYEAVRDDAAHHLTPWLSRCSKLAFTSSIPVVPKRQCIRRREPVAPRWRRNPLPSGHAHPQPVLRWQQPRHPAAAQSPATLMRNHVHAEFLPSLHMHIPAHAAVQHHAPHRSILRSSRCSEFHIDVASLSRRMDTDTQHTAQRPSDTHHHAVQTRTPGIPQDGGGGGKLRAPSLNWAISTARARAHDLSASGVHRLPFRAHRATVKGGSERSGDIEPVSFQGAVERDRYKIANFSCPRR
ncbi:hypothetical protein C8R45DRAFT_1096209 [Mycena sanguinolenta]|nr:hypothetical protein C8R45DRAFT_1096209 [Mycena sanguinolenta]